jgi:hypothetical protein
MNAVHPHCIWSADEFHARILAAVGRSYDELCLDPSFPEAWTKDLVVPTTKTKVRQTPLLGKGGSGRECGGFWRFAQEYIAAESGAGQVQTQITDRVGRIIRERIGFERYADFQFCTSGNWHDGKKRLLVDAEAEANPSELLGEFTNLLSWHCAFKCLFIYELNDLLGRLNSFCADPTNFARDWAGTTYLVAEIPGTPCAPQTWKRYRADVGQHGETIQFRRVD